MAIIEQQITFFNDEVGRVLDGAKIFSYEKDDENTPKSLWLDADETILAPYPLVASARGIFPQVYGSGAYLLVYTDKDGVEFERRDINAGTDNALTSSPVFNTVAELQTGTTYSGVFVELTEGTLCRTVGEDNPRDGIASEWIIRANDRTIDDFKYFELDNGLLAERLNNFYAGVGKELDNIELNAAKEQNTYSITATTANIPPVTTYTPVSVTVNSDDGSSNGIQNLKYTGASGAYQEFTRSYYNNIAQPKYYHQGQNMRSDQFAGSNFSDLFTSNYYGLYSPQLMTDNPFVDSTNASQRFFKPDSNNVVIGWSIDDFVVSNSTGKSFHAMRDRVLYMRYNADGTVKASRSANSGESTLPAASVIVTGTYAIDYSALTFPLDNPVAHVTANNLTNINAVLEFQSTDLIIRFYDQSNNLVDTDFMLIFNWRNS